MQIDTKPNFLEIKKQDTKELDESVEERSVKTTKKHQQLKLSASNEFSFNSSFTAANNQNKKTNDGLNENQSEAEEVYDETNFDDESLNDLLN